MGGCAGHRPSWNTRSRCGVLFLTDADIEHAPDKLRRLVAKAEQENLDLVSLMVKLFFQSALKKLFNSRFHFFKDFSFPWFNNPGRLEAACW